MGERLRNLEVAGSRGRGRQRMTRRAQLDGDMKDMGLSPGIAMNREKWRCGIMGKTFRISAEITDVKRVVVVVVVVVVLIVWSVLWCTAAEGRWAGDHKERPGRSVPGPA